MKRGFKTFLKEEDGMGVVEIILIIVVLVSLVYPVWPLFRVRHSF